MQIMKCQDFAPWFLFLKNLLILVHITYVLFVIAACIEGWWAYLIKIRFVQFLIIYSALFHHLHMQDLWKETEQKLYSMLSSLQYA